MSSEEHFDDKPLADVDEHAVAKALDSDRVFERSSAPPALVIPSASSTDEFPDEPEPEPEPEPETSSEPQSSYGHSDPATLAAAGSGPLLNPELGTPTEQTLSEATLVAMDSPAAAQIDPAEPVPSDQVQPEGLVLQPHLAHLAQVGLTDSDTWEEQIKPRIEHLHEQIDDVNVRLDHLTTRKTR
jgi:cytoskeletal protein RodZ